MYSKYQRKKALQLYDQCQSVSKVIQQLGYPTRQRLYDWIAERDCPPKNRAPRKRFNNTPEHPRHPPLSLKLDAIHRCFELGESVQLISIRGNRIQQGQYIYLAQKVHSERSRCTYEQQG